MSTRDCKSTQVMAVTRSREARELCSPTSTSAQLSAAKKTSLLWQGMLAIEQASPRHKNCDSNVMSCGWLCTAAMARVSTACSARQCHTRIDRRALLPLRDLHAGLHLHGTARPAMTIKSQIGQKEIMQ